MDVPRDLIGCKVRFFSRDSNMLNRKQHRAIELALRDSLKLKATTCSLAIPPQQSLSHFASHNANVTPAMPKEPISTGDPASKAASLLAAAATIGSVREIEFLLEPGEPSLSMQLRKLNSKVVARSGEAFHSPTHVHTYHPHKSQDKAKTHQQG